MKNKSLSGAAARTGDLKEKTKKKNIKTGGKMIDRKLIKRRQ